MQGLYKKKWNYSWQRIRKCLKPKQNKEEYNKKVIELCKLLYLEKEGFVNIYYGNSSPFKMNSYLPSSWQVKGANRAIVPQKSQGLNVFGFLSRGMDFHPYASKNNMNSGLIIGFIDDFIQTIKEPTVLVLDNATTHHSDEFKEKIKELKEQGLEIFYLPKYFPHLNLIETLWRKMKYEWMQQHYFLILSLFLMD